MLQTHFLGISRHNQQEETSSNEKPERNFFIFNAKQFEGKEEPEKILMSQNNNVDSFMEAQQKEPITKPQL